MIGRRRGNPYGTELILGCGCDRRVKTTGKIRDFHVLLGSIEMGGFI